MVPVLFFIIYILLKGKVNKMEYLKIKDEIKYHNQKYKIKREIEDMFIEEGYFYIEPSLYENLDGLESFYKKNR